MGLLATLGIGVFKNKHFAIKLPNMAQPLSTKAPTHSFVWEALEYWSKTRASGDLFASLIRPAGRDLHDWLHPHGGGSAVAPQAREWFLQWGMDLRFAASDRDWRNTSSYRPDGLPDRWQIETSSTAAFIHQLWSALEPSPTASFDHIDRAILRRSLESLFRGRKGLSPAPGSEVFREFVATVVDSQGFTGSTREIWIDFLTRRSSPEDPEIFEFSRCRGGDPQTDHLAVASRAALLLRVASGSASDLLTSAGFQSEALSFWWEGIGDARGLWDAPPSAAALDDLWADIADALTELATFQGHPPESQSVWRMTNDLGQHVLTLGSCERVALWTLLPSYA